MGNLWKLILSAEHVMHLGVNTIKRSQIIARPSILNRIMSELIFCVDGHIILNVNMITQLKIIARLLPWRRKMPAHTDSVATLILTVKVNMIRQSRITAKRLAYIRVSMIKKKVGRSWEMSG